MRLLKSGASANVRCISTVASVYICSELQGAFFTVVAHIRSLVENSCQEFGTLVFDMYRTHPNTRCAQRTVIANRCYKYSYHTTLDMSDLVIRRRTRGIIVDRLLSLRYAWWNFGFLEPVPAYRRPQQSQIAGGLNRMPLAIRWLLCFVTGGALG